jgi:hypothetical protein
LPSEANWRRSKACVGEAHCVEVADFGDIVGLRNSQSPTVTLAFGKPAWQTFIDAVKNGEIRLTTKP